MIIPEITYSTVANKCPRCHQGNVFENNNPYNFSDGLKMKENCSECNLKFEREPGFFYGALYVSYALMSGLFIIWFVSDLIWLHLDAITLTTLVVSSMLILFPVAFRWARTIWLNFFFRYNANFIKENKQFQSIKENSNTKRI